jgi:hypothetical protein
MTSVQEHRPLSALTLADYGGLVKGKTCRWCGTRLSGRIEHYEHSGGWTVAGFESKQWLYARCPKCGYQWNLMKLGIQR